MKKEILRFDGVTYIKDEIQYLDNFNMHIFQGEIMGLVCRNNFGIQALIDLLNCNLPIQYGRVYFNEIEVNTYKYSLKTVNKITVIEKKSRLVKDLTVADNVFVVRKSFRQYIISSKILNKQFEKIISETGVSINGAKLVSELTSYECIVVELTKAVVSGSKLIVIRDVSHMLSEADTANLFNLMKKLSKKGISFLYICSSYKEAVNVCNRISIMQEGRICKVLDSTQYVEGEKYIINSLDKNIKLNDIIVRNTDEESTTGDIIKFKNVTTRYLSNLSFNIKMGECVIILDTNNTIFNDMSSLMNRETSAIDGEIYVDNKIYNLSLTYKAIDAGVAVIENPIDNMIFYNMSVIENLCFLLNEKMKFHFLSNSVKKSVMNEYRKYIGDEIEEEDVRHLSMTSLYDIVYYRIHLCKPKVVFCIQPFAVEDMMLCEHISKLINELRKRKITVIILEENLSDSFITADRVLTIENGHLRHEYNKENSQF